MQTTQIITHSGCDLPPDLAKELGIRVIADIVIFGQTQHLNDESLPASRFYQMLAQAPQLPTSSHPSVGQFVEAFDCYPKGQQILCLTVTSQMSGTYETAVMAQQLLREREDAPDVYVYDSQQVSFGMTQLIIEAARLAKEGLSAEKIMGKLDTFRQRIGVYFVLGSLQNARKGGRVGAIRALAADVLGVKPVLVFENGLVSDTEIVRNFDLGLQAVAKRMRQQGDAEQTIFLFHADCRQGAEQLKQMILSDFPRANIRLEWVGPVIGIYTGPGCVGISFRRKE